ncbi:hypothetical protein KI387_016289 [Taxus chinensis]|uniref:peptidylprolyl isomerase n=1 Tax=Taxus chinensis TaxID=29808 RepID=A0AA38LGQ6_TAXCH|nr:hypothetical protein KI387_016289 [Taxus chinensis]
MGIEKELLRPGNGPKPRPGQSVTVHCTGFGKNGDLSQKFWSTKDPGQQPFTFNIGQGKVIKGWDEGVLGMQLGEIAKLRVSSFEKASSGKRCISGAGFGDLFSGNFDFWQYAFSGFWLAWLWHPPSSCTIFPAQPTVTAHQIPAATVGRTAYKHSTWRLKVYMHMEIKRCSWSSASNAKQNVVSWTAVIVASCKRGHYGEALNLFLSNVAEGIEPNGVTFSSVLPAFANLGDLKQGKEIHEDII